MGYRGKDTLTMRSTKVCFHPAETKDSYQVLLLAVSRSWPCTA
jgi:hypothetical protein